MKQIYFYLIRHGETDWNVAHRMQGSKDSPLTLKGVSEAKLTGQFLSTIPFTAAYASNQRRAITTRDLILAEQSTVLAKPACYEWAEFCEMNFGPWEGQDIRLLQHDPDFQNYLYFANKFNSSENGSEYYRDVIMRMERGLQQLASTYASSNILIVSHGMSLRLLIHALKGEPWSTHRNKDISPAILNGSISVVRYQQLHMASSGIFTVMQSNNTKHLNH